MFPAKKKTLRSSSLSSSLFHFPSSSFLGSPLSSIFSFSLVWCFLFSVYFCLPPCTAIPTVVTKTPGELNLLGIGDWGKVNSRMNDTLTHLNFLVQEENITPDNILLLGDNFYVDGVTDENDHTFNNVFVTPFSQFNALKNQDFIPICGNHDWHRNASAQIAYSGLSPLQWNFPSYYFAKVYRIEEGEERKGEERRGEMREGEREGAGKGGDVLVGAMFIDTTLLAGRFNESFLNPLRHDQKKFIEDTLSAFAKTMDYILVFGHHPIETYGRHTKGEVPILAAYLLPLLQKYGVDLYISGHDHNVQILRDKNYPLPQDHYVRKNFNTKLTKNPKFTQIYHPTQPYPSSLSSLSSPSSPSSPFSSLIPPITTQIIAGSTAFSTKTLTERPLSLHRLDFHSTNESVLHLRVTREGIEVRVFSRSSSDDYVPDPSPVVVSPPSVNTSPPRSPLMVLNEGEEGRRGEVREEEIAAERRGMMEEDEHEEFEEDETEENISECDESESEDSEEDSEGGWSMPEDRRELRESRGEIEETFADEVRRLVEGEEGGKKKKKLKRREVRDPNEEIDTVVIHSFSQRPNPYRKCIQEHGSLWLFSFESRYRKHYAYNDEKGEKRNLMDDYLAYCLSLSSPISPLLSPSTVSPSSPPSYVISSKYQTLPLSLIPPRALSPPSLNASLTPLSSLPKVRFLDDPNYHIEEFKQWFYSSQSLDPPPLPLTRCSAPSIDWRTLFACFASGASLSCLALYFFAKEKKKREQWKFAMERSNSVSELERMNRADGREKTDKIDRRNEQDKDQRERRERRETRERRERRGALTSDSSPEAGTLSEVKIVPPKDSLDLDCPRSYSKRQKSSSRASDTSALETVPFKSALYR